MANLNVVDYSWKSWKGTSGKDVANVRSYSDHASFFGYAGNDFISVNGARNTNIYGGAGNDTLKVDWQRLTENVLLDGGDGDDKIDVDGHDSKVSGGAGNDFISVKGYNWRVNGGAGNDTIQIWGRDRNVTVTGGAGKDTFRLMGPHDRKGQWITITDLSAEDVMRFEMNPEYKAVKYHPETHKPSPYYGKDGSIGYLTAKRSGSTVTLTGNTYGVNITLQNVTDLNKIANVKVFNGVRQTTLRQLIRTSALPAGVTERNNQLVISNTFRKTFDLGNYVFWSKNINAAANRQKITIKGDGRANTIVAGSAGDTLYGMGGNDNLTGGIGADTLYAGAGNDVLKGGKGNDKLFAQSGNNTLWGEAGNDYIEGGLGTDTIRGGIGNDTIKCGRGLDKIQFYKGDGKDIIQNGAKNDILYLYNINNIKTQAKFKMSGKNLVMNFTTNKNDSITITNWTTGGLNKFVVGSRTYSLAKSGNRVYVK